jgi:hypothetical protein
MFGVYKTKTVAEETGVGSVGGVAVLDSVLASVIMPPPPAPSEITPPGDTRREI